MVWVGPPLFCSGPRLGLVSDRSPVTAKPQVLPESRLEPIDSTLPEQLPPRAVLIVLQLLQNGVMTRRDIYTAVGASWRGGKGSLLCNATKTSYPGDLQRRGLVARIHRRSDGAGARRLPDLYLLTPTALDLLAAAARQQGELHDARDG